MKITTSCMAIFLAFVSSNALPSKLIEDLSRNVLWLRNDAQESEVHKSAVRSPARLWPNGTVPYFITPDFDAAERKVIEQAMEEFHTHSCIKFKPKGPHTISYINLQKVKRGCNSIVGMIGAKQPVMLSDRCLKSVTKVMHELMHVIGFYHEQSRYDRDDYVKIHHSNIRKGSKKNFQPIHVNSAQLLGTPYDFDSIMHYEHDSFAINPRKSTLTRHDGSKKFSNNQGFSKIDILRINRLYKCNKDDTCWDDDVGHCSRLFDSDGPSFCMGDELVRERCRKTCGLCEHHAISSLD